MNIDKKFKYFLQTYKYYMVNAISYNSNKKNYNYNYYFLFIFLFFFFMSEYIQYY